MFATSSLKDSLARACESSAIRLLIVDPSSSRGAIRPEPVESLAALKPWYETLVRFFQRRLANCPDPSAIESFQAAHGHVPANVRGLAPVVAVDDAATICLLDGQAYVPVVTGATDSELWAMTIDAAPIVVVVGPEGEAAVPKSPNRQVFRCESPDGSAAGDRAFVARLEEALAAYKRPGQEPTLFDSLRQKYLELHYEAESVDVYERKYHAGAAYQYMDRRLIDIVHATARRIGASSPRVLDLGCGPGSLVPLLKTIPRIQLTGADLVPEMIAEARRLYPDVTFVVDDAEALSFPDESFDIVLCSGMLHHFPTLGGVLGEIRRVLRPGGAIVAREPNDSNLAVRHPEFGVALLGLRYYLYHARSVRPVVEPDAHEYHRNFSGPTLVDALAEVFQVDDFHTTLAAAYFVDETLIGPKWIKELARLEKSLSTEPGLNIIACARKDEPGVTKSAQKQLDKYKDPKPLTIHQFEALFGFGTRAIDSHQTTSFFNSVRAPSLLDVAGLREAVAGRRVILAGSRLEPSDYSSAEAVERLGPAGPEQRHWKAFDVGVFRFESSITAAELRRLLECVQDCGIVYLEVAEIADLTDDDRTTWLSPYVILNERGGRGLNLCVSRCLQGPLDFYSALDAAFVRESDPAKLYTKKYLRMREKMNIRMGSYLRVHSYWQLFNLGRTLSNRLWVTRPAASARPAAA